LIILHGFGQICTNLTSYCTKLSILQLVGLIHTHLASYCSKLSILQFVGLIRTHLTSCCMVGAIYFYGFYSSSWEIFHWNQYVTFAWYCCYFCHLSIKSYFQLLYMVAPSSSSRGIRWWQLSSRAVNGDNGPLASGLL
jgi:hypothetical protein